MKTMYFLWKVISIYRNHFFKTRKIGLSFCFLFFLIAGKSQSFLGYNTSNYTGVSGVFFNPAYAADSRYHWSFNLFQLDASIANNAADYKISEAADALNNDKILNKLYNSRDAFAQANVDVLGPSLLFNINHRTSFAFTTRYRAVGTLNHVDGNLIEAINNNNANLPDFQTMNNNTSVALNGWMEAGITWGNVIFDKGKHFLKGGITAKYLGGVANNTIAANNINSSIQYNGNTYIAVNVSGGISLAFAGASLSNINAKDLMKFNGSGVGLDLGLSYEFRPHSEQYRHSDSSYDRSENKYMLRVSVALLDAGNIRYKKDAARSGNYTVEVKNSESYDLSALHTDLDNINNALAGNPAFFTPVASANTGTYKVSLPTHLRAEVDYHLHKGFYVNASTLLSLAKKDAVDKQNYYNNTVITPRLEGRVLGLYIPVQVNNITGFNAGAALRIGPMVVGSSNVLTAIGGSKMADSYIGFRLAGSAFHK